MKKKNFSKENRFFYKMSMDMSQLNLDAHAAQHVAHDDYWGTGAGLFGFVVLFVVLYWLMVYFNPDWVQRERDGHKTGEVDKGLAVSYAFVISVLVVVVLALLYWGFYC